MRLRSFDGADPVAYAVSLNLRRRHLDEGQRGMIAAKLANLSLGANQHSRGSASLPTLPGVASPTPPVTQARAADLLNVSERTATASKAVRNHGVPELVEAAERGEIAVSAAAEIARHPAEAQREAIEVHNHRERDPGENEWYTPALYIAAVRQALGEIDLDPASSAEPDLASLLSSARSVGSQSNGDRAQVNKQVHHAALCILRRFRRPADCPAR